MKKSFKYNLIAIIVGLPLIIYVVVFNNRSQKENEKLPTEGVIDTALIVRSFTGAKARLYYEYIFHVGESKFNGFIQYSPSFGPLEVNDSCLVVYLPEDPDNVNELCRNEDRTLKLLR